MDKRTTQTGREPGMRSCGVWSWRSQGHLVPSAHTAIESAVIPARCMIAAGLEEAEVASKLQREHTRVPAKGWKNCHIMLSWLLPWLLLLPYLR